MLIVRKIENFDELQLPYILIFFTEVLHPLPTYFLFCLDTELLIILVFVSL